MRPPLGVLDQCPVPEGGDPEGAVAASLALAEAAEDLGYRRYWVAEHHNTPSLGCASPVVLLAAAAARTRTIRLGSGGVLLPYASPLAVAEDFRLLAALAPGRVDLGVGRAAGADPAAEAALHHRHDGSVPEDFDERLVDLVALLDDAPLPTGHPLLGVRAAPMPAAGAGVTGPEVWVLGSSTRGASRAAYLGLPFAFAHFITDRFGAQVVRSYRRGFTPRPPSRAGPRAAVAVSVVCAPTAGRAEGLAASLDLWWLRRGAAERGPLLGPEEATAELARLDDLERARVAEHRASVVVGDPATAVERLAAVARDLDADEVLVLTNCHDPTDRLRSYELLAHHWARA